MEQFKALNELDVVRQSFFSFSFQLQIATLTDFLLHFFCHLKVVRFVGLLVRLSKEDLAK